MVSESSLFVGLIFLAVLLEGGADVLFKQWAIEQKTLLLGIGLFLYALGTVFWAFSIKYHPLSKAVAVFTILNLLVVVAIGVFYFGEELTLANKVGLVLGVVSIFLLEVW